MTARVCQHEADVLDLVAIDQWPQRADDRLRAHVAACAACAEVASIAAAVREWNEAEPVARMPEAALVWHRAQVRARDDAARAAARPVWMAQAFAVVSLVVALIWIGPSAAWYATAWQSVTGAFPSASIGVPQAPALPAGLGSLPAGWGWSVGLALAGAALFVSLVIGAVKITEHSELSK
jgi:hypothetical protein